MDNTKRKNIVAILLLTGLLGAACQLVILFAFLDPNELFWPDPKLYFAIATDLSEGIPYSTPEKPFNLLVSPGYPFLLSFLIRLVGPSVLVIRLIIVALYPLFALILYWMGRSCHNRRTGLIFSFLCIIYPYYLYVPLTLYSESLSVFLIPVIFLMIFSSRDHLHLLKVGILAALIALAIMIRPTYIFLIPVSIFHLLFKNSRICRKYLVAAIVLLVIPSICVASWLARNKFVHGHFLFSASGSITLLKTYNTNTRPGIKEMVDLPEDVKKRLESAENIIEVNKISSEESSRFIREYPGRALKIAFLNCLNYWSPIPQTYIQTGMAQDKIKIIAALPYSILLIMGIMGFFMIRRKVFAITLLASMFLNTLLNAPIMVSVRYRLIMDFAFILFAGVALDYMLNRINEKYSSIKSKENAGNAI